MPGSRSRRDLLRSSLLIVAALAGLVAVRWSVTGSINQPIVTPAPTVAPASTVAASLGLLSSFLAVAGPGVSWGGRRPSVVVPTSGSIRRMAPAAVHDMSLF